MFFDHISMGALISSSTNKFNLPLFMLVLISSILPDGPIIFIGGPGTIEYLLHRSYSHSILLAPVYSFILTLLMFTLFKKYLKNKFIVLYSFSLLAVLSHILLDLITPFGIELFYPFSNKLYSLDILHSFDPIFLSISIIVLITFACFLYTRNIKFRTITRILSFLYIFYFIFTLISKLYVSNKYKEYLADKIPQANYISTIPRTFWRWKGIASNKDNYYAIVENNGIISHSIYNKKTDIPNTIQEDLTYKKFMKYARYPIMTLENNKVIFSNLIYSPDTYKLSYKLDKNYDIVEVNLTGFNIEDKHY